MGLNSYAQGMDATMLLHDFIGYTLLPGDTVRGQFRLALADPVPIAEIGIDGVTATVDVLAQTVLITIPEAVNITWQPPALRFYVHTTLLIVAADGSHQRPPIEIDMDWRASYTKGAG